MVSGGTAMRVDHSLTRSSTCSSPWSREDCRSSISSAARIAGLFQGARAERPEGGNPGQAGEAVPLVRQVQVEQPLAGPGRAGIHIFQRQQGRVADQQRRVGDRKHGFKIGRVGNKHRRDFPEDIEQDAGVSVRGTRRSVRRNRAHRAYALRGGRTTRMMERTRSSAATVQPGTTSSDGVVA
jgi:hypothetical protein